MKSIRTDIFHLFPTCYRVVISYEKGLIKHEEGKKDEEILSVINLRRGIRSCDRSCAQILAQKQAETRGTLESGSPLPVLHAILPVRLRLSLSFHRRRVLVQRNTPKRRDRNEDRWPPGTPELYLRTILVALPYLDLSSAEERASRGTVSR